MSEVAVRFWVGDGETRRAATWKCWANVGSGKNDVYLTCRELRGALKTSLHGSGEWHVGFERQFLGEHGAPGEWPTRIMQSWQRPAELVPGVTVAHRIVTPSATVNVPLPSPATGIAWVPPPPDGQAVEIDIIITAQGVQTTGWPGKRSMGTRLVGTFQLETGETVWIVWHVVDLPPAEISLASSNARYFYGKTREHIRGTGIRAICFGSEPDGSRVMYEAVLHQENEPALLEP